MAVGRIVSKMLNEDYEIDIKTEDVRETADIIEKYNNKIRDEFDYVNRSINSVMNNWNSPAKEIAQRRFKVIKNTYQDGYNNRYDVINSYVELLREPVATGYEITEETNTKISEAYK